MQIPQETSADRPCFYNTNKLQLAADAKSGAL